MQFLTRPGAKSALLFLVIAVLAACGRSSVPLKPSSLARGDYSYAKAYMHWYAKELLEEHNTPALSIALVDDQKVVWAQGFGYADVAEKRRATAETVYRVGSIAKVFTASAAMRLREQGKLDIDSAIQRYLPEFSIGSRFKNARPVTARSIMTHHSGLPADIMKGMWTPDGSARYTDVVKLMRDEYVAYPPGYIYSYSNAALSLLGHAVQRAAGKPFPEYVREHFIQPLEMKRTTYRLDPKTRALLARGYSDGEAIDTGELRDLPAGGLYSNVMDLSNYMRMMFADGQYAGRPVLQAGTLAEMMRVQNDGVALDFNLPIGLGFFRVKHGIEYAGPVVSHGGGAPCYFSQMIMLPEHKLGAVALANSCSSGAVVAESASRLLKLALEAKTGIRQPLEYKLKKAPVAEVPDAGHLKDFEGRYATWLGLIDVHRDGTRLKARISGWNFDLVPLEDKTFGVEFRLFGLIHLRHLYGIDFDNVLLRHANVDGRRVVVMTFKGRDQVLGAKVQPEPIPAAWLARVGKMEIFNQDEYMHFRDNELVVDNGILVMKYRLKMPVLSEQSASLPIRPISDNEAVVMGLGRGMGETVRIDRESGQEVLHYSGYKAHWTSYSNSQLAHAVGVTPRIN